MASSALLLGVAQAEEKPIENLISLVSSNKSNDEIADYLKYRERKRLPLLSELSSKDSLGNTPLHLAVQKLNIELVKILLSFDAPINLPNNDGLTVESLLSVCIQNSQGEEQIKFKKLAALIRSRQKLQKVAQQGVAFNRSIRIIEEAIAKIACAEKQDALLIFGKTGEGKTTFVNFMSGIDYQRLRSKPNKIEKKESIPFLGECSSNCVSIIIAVPNLSGRQNKFAAEK